jgi:hypothetical protein
MNQEIRHLSIRSKINSLKFDRFTLMIHRNDLKSRIFICQMPVHVFHLSPFDSFTINVKFQQVSFNLFELKKINCFLSRKFNWMIASDNFPVKLTVFPIYRCRHIAAQVTIFSFFFWAERIYLHISGTGARNNVCVHSLTHT